MTGAWESVIGLEVHVQLRTAEKLFCPSPVGFGGEPNSRVCPVCLGLPGALPVLNGEAVRLALIAAVALECRVHETSVFARKNYFYPDLPRGYQISQFDRPLASGGRFTSVDGDAVARIRRIHMEEDAGKSLHDRIPGSTAIDLNRAGTPLVEIVTEPDLRTPEQVRSFLLELRRLLRYLDVSDCSMEEGSLRVDANVSVRSVGASELGTKTELKNMNSFSGVEKALEVEIARHIELLESGRNVEQETLLWDEGRAQVRSMRSKEESHDYRYFPDPDLPPLVLDPAEIEAARSALPELPADRERRFASELGLPAYDAAVLTAERDTAELFEAVLDEGVEPKEASNWMMGPVLRAANERGVAVGALSLPPGELSALIRSVLDGTVSHASARSVLESVIETGRGALQIIEEQELAQVSSPDALTAWIEDAMTTHPEEVDRYRGGEERLLGFFMGEVMKRSEGRADPRRARELLSRALQDR